MDPGSRRSVPPEDMSGFYKPATELDEFGVHGGLLFEEESITQVVLLLALAKIQRAKHPNTTECQLQALHQ